ncbi:hypothetical protein [Nonomuraea glycinis]|uniref:hypothetical protein n=1 Tax=Nonomuraea glycinis TaxID=2047744 RepID=UPI0033A04926
MSRLLQRWGEASRCRSSGKVRHWTRQDAKQWSRIAHRGERMQAYRCDTCGFWHLGHAHESGTRRPEARCQVDTLPVFEDPGSAGAYAERMGPDWLPVRCADHWHAYQLPAL